MKGKNQHRLRLIQVLMVSSELLLLAFIGYWLRSEYASEKNRLQKDLTVELREAYNDVADSLLIENFVRPIMLEAGANADTVFNAQPVFIYKGDGSHLPSKGSLITSIQNDSATEVRIRNSKKRIKYELNIMDSIGNTDTNFHVNISEVDSASYKDVMSSIYVLLARAMVKDSLIKKDMISVLGDTIYSEFTLEKIVNDKGKRFTAKWVSDDSTREVKGVKQIRISLENNKQVQVSGYEMHLLKKITPQILFTLLLLLTSGIAFWMTYRSLRKQIRLSELKNGLISNMSHELKTPVSTVKVALEALDDFDVVNQPEKAREYIHMAMLETHRLELLVNKALNTSLMEQGKMTLERQPVNLFNLVEDIVSALRLRLEQKGASINLSSEGNNFITNADKLHVQGAVMNIIDNSMKYGSEHVVIDIRIIAKDASITIEISDNGPGIPEKYIEQVFEKFFRVPEGDRHNVKGYGLGLSYVRQVMHMHNGSATIKNLTGRGCLFSLQFFRGR